SGIKVRPLRPGSAEETEPPKDELVELDADRRARLVAFVEGNQRMPQDAKERVLAQLRQDRVPMQVVARIESRMGG
ncbi:MAG: efflux transporter periplasmic adaptor subunit, partial [Pseudomonadota bacterium]